VQNFESPGCSQHTGSNSGLSGGCSCVVSSLEILDSKGGRWNEGKTDKGVITQARAPLVEVLDQAFSLKLLECRENRLAIIVAGDGKNSERRTRTLPCPEHRAKFPKDELRLRPREVNRRSTRRAWTQVAAEYQCVRFAAQGRLTGGLVKRQMAVQVRGVDEASQGSLPKRRDA